ncbi:MAG: bifunctional nuclease family protein [Odoribacter sp.]
MDRVKLKVLGLSYSMSQAGAYALILSDEQDLHRIPIVIGMPEAQSIAIQLEKIQTQRPLTHDLVKTLADALKVALKEVFIYHLEAGIFYAELLFEADKSIVKIDSRTSDAIALALRYGCPIYTTPEIVEKAGILVGQEGNHSEQPTFVREIENEKDSMLDYSVQELGRMLDEAVQNEEYEKASKIRDVLKNKNKE